jgi:hypothetical protein
MVWDCEHDCIGLLDSFASYGALYPTSNLIGVKSIWTSEDNEVLPRNLMLHMPWDIPVILE